MADSYRISYNLFLRMLAAIFFIAFISLWVQIQGLIGSNGILPVSDFLRLVSERLGAERYWVVPSIFWWNSSDFFLHAICAAGAGISILLFFGIAPSVLLFVLWFLYLSLASVCRDFLGFQWDVLLLETGFLSIFLIPRPILARHSSQSAPNQITLWLMWWLLFRLVLSSGLVKILGGDPTWRGFTAMHYHYETQPLPTWIGWYAHQLPFGFQKFSTFCVLILEIVFPFLIFLRRGFRIVAFFSIIFLQTLIFVTGNYCFFNLLTVALSFLLLDDTCWPASMQRTKESQDKKYAPLPRAILIPVCAFLFLCSLLQMSSTIQWRIEWPGPILKLDRLMAPFRSVNSYGLFAVMTTRRDEIILEGSNDGENWQAYEFKYKPGDVLRHPGFVEPYQPRLDWQMWFAALETYQSN